MSDRALAQRLVRVAGAIALPRFSCSLAGAH
jgi:hypothetical protein